FPSTIIAPIGPPPSTLTVNVLSSFNIAPIIAEIVSVLPIAAVVVAQVSCRLLPSSTVSVLVMALARIFALYAVAFTNLSFMLYISFIITKPVLTYLHYCYKLNAILLMLSMDLLHHFVLDDLQLVPITHL